MFKIPEKNIRQLLQDGELEMDKEGELCELLEKALKLKGLSLQESAKLLNATDEKSLEKIFKAAKEVKLRIYGKRLVLFAPLYISSYCVNNCSYCGFHCENKAKRKKLSMEEVKKQVEILVDMGHKRLLLEFGEDPKECPIDYVIDVIKAVYSVKKGNGEIRRVNVNIAATSEEDYAKLKEVGIGTYQLFQETYHKDTYTKLHSGPKANFERQLGAHERAFKAGIDDYGMGVLFGLYDYKYEVLALLAHVEYLNNTLGVGPHTISVPRFCSAPTVNYEAEYPVSDLDFLKLIAVIRLSVPYTGMIISTRESPEIRRKAFQIGISQTSAASRTSPGGYGQEEESTQFSISDHRSLDEVVCDICRCGYFPSFCTACYRQGRTGEHFMDLAKSADIHYLCRPNAILTFQEYLEDYASEETKAVGAEVVTNEMSKISDNGCKNQTKAKILRIKNGERDLYF